MMKLLLILTAVALTWNGSLSAATLAGVHYYRQLAYNHVSPHVPIVGIREISEATALTAPHYRFTYDQQGRLTEILRRTPEDGNRHPLANIGAFRTVFSYTPGHETRTYFAEDGNPTKNCRGVWCEDFEYTAEGFKCALRELDLDGKPMESVWNIARYTWEKHGGLVVERRYRLDGSEAPLSTYFAFGTTGIKYGANGLPEAHFNLNEKLEPANNDNGVASYNDRYDDAGNHVEITYRDAQGALTLAPRRFAVIKKHYDDAGFIDHIEYLDTQGRLLSKNDLAHSADGHLIKPQHP